MGQFAFWKGVAGCQAGNGVEAGTDGVPGIVLSIRDTDGHKMKSPSSQTF